MERGIITSAMDIVSKGSSVSINGGISPEKCRYYALYWDKVVLTDSNIFGTGISGDLKILEDAGIVRKETARMDLNGSFDGSGLAKIHLQGLAQVATELMNKNPGQWVIHQSGDQLIIPEKLSKELVTADFELTRCLPVPNADFPLDKLLEFKLKRSDELAALRETLDDIYLEISKSSDIPRSKIIQIQRLEQAISDLDKVAKQSWGARLLASRKVSLNLNYGSIIGILHDQFTLFEAKLRFSGASHKKCKLLLWRYEGCPIINGATTGSIVGSHFSNPIVGIAVGAANTLFSSLKFEVSISMVRTVFSVVL